VTTSWKRALPRQRLTSRLRHPLHPTTASHHGRRRTTSIKGCTRSGAAHPSADAAGGRGTAWWASWTSRSSGRWPPSR
jgi:hypothetical protein